MTNYIEDYAFLYTETMRALFGNTYRYSSTENLINSSLDDVDIYKNVISADGENELKTILYINNSKEFPIETCPITFIEFEHGSEVIKLPCKHYFIPYGIHKWLSEVRAECPMCRYKLSSDEKK